MLIAREQMAAIDDCLADAARESASGLMLVHLRGFRQLAALLGGEAAGAVSDTVGARLRLLLRPVDQVLRVAVDEFLLVLPGLLSENHGVLAARKVLREFETPLLVGGQPMTPLLTLALAVDDARPARADALWRRALVALEGAIDQNRRFALAEHRSDDLWLQDDLREALVHNELKVMFQPVYRLSDRSVVAVEGLARWHSQRHGVIAPNRFIALAEQAGLAPELTRWSVHTVLREYAPLRRCAPALRCAINLSPKVFSHSGFEEQISSALSVWDIPASSLTLEVTETAVMEDPDLSAVSLRNLREAGVRIAIDDFGQGYSSFSYLKHFPAIELKIDQSFVMPIARDPRARQLAHAMVDLAHHLGMEAVGEGVEDEQTAAVLAEIGCDLAQGFHLARPMPAAELMALL